MNADDLIAAFTELADVDPETRIFRTRVGDAEEVQLVPSYKKNEVQRFKALAADAVTLFDLPGPSDLVTRWLRFVLDNAPELVEDCEQRPVRSLGYAIEHHDDGTERRVPFIAQTLPNAASASTLVVRRCRRSIEQGELIERAQVDLARFGDTTMATSDVKAKLITVTVAVQRYAVSRSTLRREVGKGTLRDARLPGSATNSPLLLDEDQIARRWLKKGRS